MNDIDKKIFNRTFVASLATMFVYAASVFILPVSLENIRKDLSLNLTQGGIFGFLSSIAQFIIMVSSCFISAHFGKIKTLRFSLLIVSLAFIIFSFVNNYIIALLVYIFFGLGSGVLEALLTPFVQDLYPDDKGQKQNLLHSFWPLGSITSFILAGFLLSNEISWRYIFLGYAIVIAFVIFLYPSSKKISLPLSSTSLMHIKEILTEPIFYLLGFALFLAGGAEIAFGFWLPTLVQIHFGGSPFFGGVAAALFSLGMFIGRVTVSNIAKHISLYKIMIISAIFSLIFSITFVVFESIVIMYIFTFIMGLSIACQWPSLQTFAVDIIKKDATLIMVFLSCFGIPGSSSATLILGVLGDKYGLKNAFYIIPVYLLLFLILLIIAGIIIKKGKLKYSKL